MATTSDNTLQLDGIDKIILRALMENARQSINHLATQVGISGTAVHQRLKKLEREGVISGSQLMVNEKVLGYKTRAFVGIFLDKAMRNPEAVQRLKKIPEVIECHYTTGNWSVFIKILCRDNAHLMELLNREIQTIEGVSRTETFISLDQQINRQVGI
jgi:Lrp/AsnC family transcriptional regulator for asnA, asnC and gidA